MARVLVIGGTRFVGRHLVAEALSRGHDVTMLHRGRTCDPALFAGARHLHADRDGALDELAGDSWDVTVDVCAYKPGQVSRLARALGGRGGRFVLVSTVSVYAPPPAAGADEDAPLATLPGAVAALGDAAPVTGENYGGLKALCEAAALVELGPTTLVLRPTYVIGPHDHTWRFVSWVLRIAAGGEVLAPGPVDGPVQFIDARDFAVFALDRIEAGGAGAFHTVTPAPPFGFQAFLEAIAAEVAPAGTRLTWVDEAFLREAGEDGRSLPMWSGSDADRFVLAMDPSRAVAAGLRARPFGDTVRDTLAWARTSPAARVEGVGLAASREAELLERWRG